MHPFTWLNGFNKSDLKKKYGMKSEIGFVAIGYSYSNSLFNKDIRRKWFCNRADVKWNMHDSFVVNALSDETLRMMMYKIMGRQKRCYYVYRLCPV